MKKENCRKFKKEDVVNACFEGKSKTLILMHEEDLPSDEYEAEEGKHWHQYILKAKDDKKFYSYVRFTRFGGNIEPGEEVELYEVKKKRKTITVYE